MRVPFNRSFLIFALALCAFAATNASAQWRLSTPRECIYVPANSSTWTRTHIYASSCVKMQYTITGMFGAFTSNDSADFDAGYTYKIPGWAAPFPLKNPPAWNGKSLSIYLQIDPTGNAPAQIQLQQTSPQSNHQYTALYQATGTYTRFRIYDQLDQWPDGSKYKQATGGLAICAAQYTAGMSVQSRNINFGPLNVGSESTIIDSIASYGIDPLTIDSVWIDGSSDFTVVSDHGLQFTLPNESANGFHITYSPKSASGSSGTLHIVSKNAECTSTHVDIALNGTGVAPIETIGPSQLDFGVDRDAWPLVQSTTISNTGSGTLFVTLDSISYDAGTPSSVFQCTLGATPIALQGIGTASSLPLYFRFIPIAEQCYGAWAYLHSNTGEHDRIRLMGCGAKPRVIATRTSIDFGKVMSYATATQYDTIRNLGGWTAHITSVTLSGQNPAAFAFTPTDPSFLLNAGDSRDYVISFTPRSQTDAALTAKLVFSFDDGSLPLEVILNGTEQRAKMKYDTNFVDFGKVKVGTCATVVIHDTNTAGKQMRYDYTTSNTNFYISYPQPQYFKVGVDTLQFRFCPDKRGAQGAWIRIMTTENGQVDSFFVQGYGAMPKPVFTPPIIDFGKVPTGYSSYQSTVITDTGDYPLYICDLEVVGDTAFRIAPQTPKPPFTIMDGGKASQFVGVNFLTNQKLGLFHRATLKITYCDGTVDSIPIFATEAKQGITYATPRIDFGKVHIGSSKTGYAKYWNPMKAAQTVGSIWTVPNDPFHAIDQTLTVKGSSFDSAAVSFAPTVRGLVQGWHHSGGQDMDADSIPLTGIAVAAVPVLSTLYHTFDTVDIGFSNSFTFSLSDTGDYALTAHIEKTLDPYNEFNVIETRSGKKIDRTLDDAVDIDSTHFYSVTFSPKRAQLPYHEADLVFTFNDGGTQTARLIGYDSSIFLAFDRDTIDFGKVRIGTTPPTQTVNLQNTSGHTLPAADIAMPGLPFTSSPSSGIVVTPHSDLPLTITFAPTGMGPFQSKMTGHSNFIAGNGDVVILKGTGAQPVPKLSVDTLDFGTLPNGVGSSRTFTLTNNGNWPLTFHTALIPSLNGNPTADFKPWMPSIDTTIAEGESATFTVDYLATTPLQIPPREALLVFTEDDGSTFALDLIARDKPPLYVKVGFHNYSARAGDRVTAYLNLLDSIPDTMKVQHIRGTITYDNTVAELTSPITPGALVPFPLWSIWTTPPGNAPQGMIQFDIQSNTDALTQAGTLLKFEFKIRDNVDSNAVCSLLAVDTFPDTKLVVAETAPASIFLESQCGRIPLNADVPMATFIDQNSPNPFGSKSPTTTVPFDVGPDGAMITLRILDATGRERSRPIDNEFYQQGRYKVTINSNDLGSGTFFYEFRTNNDVRMIKKMTVD